MHIQRFTNPVYSSNTFIIDNDTKNVIIIDPGNEDIKALLSWLKTHNKTPGYIILTHEHLDHIVGINKLGEHYNFQLIASEACKQNMADSKKNFSRYHDTIPEFTVTMPVATVFDNQIMQIIGIPLKFILTPGHSEGSMCLMSDNIAFTGDTFMQTTTPLNIPGSNKEEYALSYQKLLQHFNEQTVVYPGHGDAFQVNPDILFANQSRPEPR